MEKRPVTPRSQTEINRDYHTAITQAELDETIDHSVRFSLCSNRKGDLPTSYWSLVGDFGLPLTGYLDLGLTVVNTRYRGGRESCLIIHFGHRSHLRHVKSQSNRTDVHWLA